MTLIPRTITMLSWNSSTATSVPIFVGDVVRMSVSLTTTTAASTYTLQGSNADGFATAIPSGQWSTVTALTAPGIYAIQTGMRWLRAQQAASTSSATLQLEKIIGS
jgi:hypothetical protein